MRNSRFAGRYRGQNDLGQTLAFLVVLFLLASVGVAIFFGVASVFAPIRSQPDTSAFASVGAGVPQRTSSVQQPTFTAPTQVPLRAGVAIQLSPAITAVASDATSTSALHSTNP